MEKRQSTGPSRASDIPYGAVDNNRAVRYACLMTNYPEPDTSPLGRFRDAVAYRLFLLAHAVATPFYGGMMSGAVRYGLAAAKRDAEAEE